MVSNTAQRLANEHAHRQRLVTQAKSIVDEIAQLDHDFTDVYDVLVRVQEYVDDAVDTFYGENPGLSGAIPGCECGCGGDYLFEGVK